MANYDESMALELMGGKTEGMNAPTPTNIGGMNKYDDLFDLDSMYNPNPLPPRPNLDLTLGQILMHNMGRGVNFMGNRASNLFQNANNWWSQNKPQLTRTSKAFYEDGTPVIGDDGTQVTSTQPVSFRSPITFQNPLVMGRPNMPEIPISEDDDFEDMEY
tara:strand:+ start:34 stop:513 length:480 start_codon:yes stop_codon:yes gene_type:complete